MLPDFRGGGEFQRRLDIGAKGKSRPDLNIRWTPLLFFYKGPGERENRCIATIV